MIYLYEQKTYLTLQIIIISQNNHLFDHVEHDYNH